MKKHKPEPTRGGARKGAGKKPGIMGKKVKKIHALSPDVAAYLESQMGEGKPGASAVIESLIRKSRQFKSWLAATKAD